MSPEVDAEIIAHKGDHYLLRCTCPVCGETWEIDTILDHGSFFACNEDRDECPFAEEHEKEIGGNEQDRPSFTEEKT